jgi:hypothetical protein
MLLSLKSLTLDAPINQSGESLILTELILPRSGIAKKSALKDLRLSKGKASLTRAPFYEKALLKEKVVGRFGIKVSVTRPLKHPELNRFLRQLLATGIESASDTLASLLVRAAPLEDVVKKAGDLFADTIGSESPTFIATGGIELDSETLSAGPVTIDLKLEETLRLSDLPPGPKAREKRKTSAKLYKKGSAVGRIIFDLGV